MIFSSPSFLWALGLLSIPIIIHLFHFKRYKKLYFSDITLLKEFESKSRTSNRLKNWLILATRLLVLGLSILAFSEPIIPGKNISTDNVEQINLYVDNSKSMEVLGPNGTLLQEALNNAYAVISSSEPNVRFRVVTNEFSGMSKRLISKQSAIEAIDQVKSSAAHKSLNEVLSFIGQTSTSEGSVTYVISDFNNLSDSAAVPESSDSLELRLVPIISKPQHNISIDTCWLNRPFLKKGLEHELHVQVSNHSDSSIAYTQIRVVVDGNTLSSIPVNIPPGNSLDTSVNVVPTKTGLLEGTVYIEDQSLRFDNTFDFVLNVKDKIKVVVISTSDKETAFAQVFDEEDHELIVFDENEVKLEEVASSDLLVLSQLSSLSEALENEIHTFSKDGKNIILIPSVELGASTKESLNRVFGLDFTEWDTTQSEVTKLELRSSLFQQTFEEVSENLSLPSVTGHWQIGSTPPLTSICHLGNGTGLVSEKRLNNGTLYVISTPLESQYTNLSRHALFVPIMINAGLTSGRSPSVSYSLRTNRVRVSGFEEGVQIVSKAEDLSFLPSIHHNGIGLQGQVCKAGIYYLTNRNDSLLTTLAFYEERDESSLETDDLAQLATALGNEGYKVFQFNSDNQSLSGQLKAKDSHTKLWPWFVFAALIFLFIESIFLKRWTS